jgi:diguanylate cyclase (GGDEF)-like protein/PAS domain S-box-containing protein
MSLRSLPQLDLSAQALERRSMRHWHSLLRRQIERHLGGLKGVPLAWYDFVDAISQAYWQADADRGMLEHSIDRSAEELLQANVELQRSLSLLRATLESTADGILVVDRDGRVVTFNKKFADMWRLSDELIAACDREALLAHTLEKLERPDTYCARLREISSDGEATSHDVLELSDGRVFELHAQPQRIAGASVGRVFCYRDVTQQRRAEETLRHRAYHDDLTGLPNRLLFRDRFGQALGLARRSQQTLATLFFDLDRFKTINDTLGHDVGDRLLQGVSQRLLGLKRAGDTLARLGGDEFLLLVSNVRHLEDAAKAAENFLRALRPAFQLDGHELHVTASAGISLFPFDGDDPDTLVKHAEIALYRAKERGCDAYEIYSPQMNARALERLVLENELRRALERNEFELSYQPQVDVERGTIVGTEALIRWRRSGGEVMLPSDFIPLAEDAGVIGPLGDWVLRGACAQIREWRRAGLPPLRIAVNLSASQFQRDSLIADVESTLEQTALEPAALQLELTESAIMRNPDQGAASLRQIRSMGVGVAIDDFGTGYSSLSHLKRFPISALKIDRSFVRDCLRDPDDAAIVTAIISMARSLRLEVVAEGVETAEQVAFLRERGCVEMQGFYFSRPLGAQAFAGLVGERRHWIA